MNEESVLRSELRENRLTIIIMSAISAVLAVVLVVLLIVKNNAGEVEKETSVAVVEKEEAAENVVDLVGQVDEIHATIRNLYGEKMNGYEIATGKLLLDGDWYVTTISQPPVDQWSLPEDTYRVVMRKVGGQWQIVAGPSLIFSYVEYPDIPEGVILSANNL